MTVRSWPPPSSRRVLRRGLHRYRRPIRAALVATAVAAALTVLAPAPAPGRAVVVAAADLGAGHLLAPGDLVVAQFAAGEVPDGSYTRADAVVGRSLAGAVRRGEPMTDARVAGSAALTGSTGLVEVAVRLADADATGLVRPGDLVDVLAAGPDPTSAGYLDPATTLPPDGTATTGQAMAAVVAASARVLDVPTAPGTGVVGSGGSDGALVVLAVTPATARVLAAAAARARLSVLIRPGATGP